MFEIIGIPAFKDNYIWLLRKGAAAVVVDPGDAAPVLEVLQRERLSLEAILITHHHQDHQGGVPTLLSHFAAEVYGPATESITALTHPLRGGEVLMLPALGCTVRVISTPGHTAGHVAYLAGDALFCGDTLFSAGCGRVFEGTATQMSMSLSLLAALPDATRVYCAHEYTEANLRFAMTVEPGNRFLRDRVDEVAVLRAKGQPSVPSLLSLEKTTNPFLRCNVPEVVESARQHGAASLEPADVFAELRSWKNTF
ncbi:hydroxyacylglutathione hydrolase [uncultured Propionivibrio sp.]|uniref:hydroxyacylglutathione hydrolase n=1 Tax=uncultured Propionivibrio sp. TaxID=426737 RepID=UPI0029C033CC|nr:hydroxyacylglutathione hydrolase [uncultured Propionivibrio sp.]